jgi:hypothetical protein
MGKGDTMTIKELIEELQHYPENTPVFSRVRTHGEDQDEWEEKVPAKPWLYCGEIFLES